MEKYITYEEPLKGRSFTAQQMHEVYRVLQIKRNTQCFQSGFWT